MADVLTVREAVQRAKDEGLPVAEGAVRRWVKSGEIPHRTAGRKILIYYPGLVRYLKCEDVGGETSATDIRVSGIRRVEV